MRTNIHPFRPLVEDISLSSIFKKSVVFCVIIVFFALRTAAQYEGYTAEQFLSPSNASADTVFIRAMVMKSYEFSAISTDTALALGTKALELSENAHWQPGVALSNVVLGIASQTRADYQDALKYYFDALRIYEGLGAEGLITQTKSRCANVYQDTEQFEKALAIRLGNIEVMPKDIYLGYEYSNTGKIYEALENYDSAEYYYQRGLEVFEKQLPTDPRAYRGKAIIARDLASNFYYRDQPDSVMKYVQVSIDIFQELDVPYESALSYLVLVRTLMNQKGDLGQSHIYTQKILELAESIKAKYVLMDLYKEYSRLFELEEDFQSSLAAYKKHTALKDSILGPKVLIGLALLQAEDEEMRGLEQERAAKAGSKMRMHEIILIGAVLLLMAILSRTYLHNRRKETRS